MGPVEVSFRETTEAPVQDFQELPIFLKSVPACWDAVTARDLFYSRFASTTQATNMTKATIGKLKSVPEALQKSISRTQVEYRRLGKSGLRVSNPILGGLHIGDSQWFPWVLDEEKVSLFRFLSSFYHSFYTIKTFINIIVGTTAFESCI